MEQQQHMDGSVYIIMMIILTMCLKVDNLRCGLAPFSITSSVSASSASWNSEAFTGTNVAGASYSSFKISSSGTLRVSFVDGADIYKGNIVYRPMATIYYGI